MSKPNPEVSTFIYRHRVRYRECDPMGVVYHAHYIDFFEAARTEGLRHAGLAYKDLEADGFILPVVEVQVSYRRPAFYDDELDITVRVTQPQSPRLSTEYEVRRAGETQILATGSVVLVFVDAETRRPTPPPDYVAQLFSRQ